MDHVTRGYFYLNVSSNNIQSPSQGGTYTITIDTNTNWEIINIDTDTDWWIENDTDWLSFSPTGGPSGWNGTTVYVHEWENPDNEESRTATFNVGYESQSGIFNRKSVVVTQLNDTTITPDSAAI